MTRGVRSVRPVLSTLVVAVIVGIPSTSRAQAPGAEFGQLSSRLKPNEAVQVTDAEGHRHRGLVKQIGPQVLVLEYAGYETESFADNRIREVAVLHEHKLAGALIGLGSGAAIGFAIGTTSEPSFPFSHHDLQVVGTMFFGAIGAGVGAIAGMFVHGEPQVIYQASPAARGAHVTIAPFIAPHGKGLALAVRF